MRNGHMNGSPLSEMPTEANAAAHVMHRHLRNARAAFSPSTAPDLSDVPAPRSVPVSPEVAAAAIDADHEDVRASMREMVEQLKIEDGDSAATICARLSEAIDARLALVAEGRVKSQHVTVTPMRRDGNTGQWRNGYRVDVTEYHG